MGTLPPELVREEARLDLEGIARIFESHKVPFFLTYGALLGIVRDGDFIKYDDDIDLVVTEQITYEKRKLIGNTLLDLGYTPQPIAFRVYGRLEASEPGYNGDAHSGIIVCQKRIRTTIFFFGQEDCHIHGSCHVCHPKLGSPRLISTPSKFFEKTELVRYKGLYYNAPSPVKEYLEYTYGKDWKKPIKGKHAPKWVDQHPAMPNEARV